MAEERLRKLEREREERESERERVGREVVFEEAQQEACGARLSLVSHGWGRDGGGMGGGSHWGRELVVVCLCLALVRGTKLQFTFVHF